MARKKRATDDVNVVDELNENTVSSTITTEDDDVIQQLKYEIESLRNENTQLRSLVESLKKSVSETQEKYNMCMSNQKTILEDLDKLWASFQKPIIITHRPDLRILNKAFSFRETTLNILVVEYHGTSNIYSS